MQRNEYKVIAGRDPGGLGGGLLWAGRGMDQLGSIPDVAWVGLDLEKGVRKCPSCFSYENLVHQVLFSEKRNWKGNRVDGRSEDGEDMYTEPATLHLRCF